MTCATCGAPHHVALPRCKWSAALCRPVGSHPLPVVLLSGQPHCSVLSTRLACYDDAACPHVLHVHDGSVVRRLRNSRREPSCIGRPARSLFIYLRPMTHWRPQDAWQHRDPPWLGGRVRSHKTRGSARAHLSREVRSEVIGHVAASEPTLVGRRDPEP
jgi:hypothetical protein